MTELKYGGGAASASPDETAALQRYLAWFHELDAWTEYWDIYHPETSGHFYFGNGGTEPGVLTRFLPRDRRPPPFVAWTRMALSPDSATAAAFANEVRVPEVAAAIMEVDQLLSRLFAKHFGDASDPRVQSDYLEAMFRFALNSLPPALERDARISDEDPRKATAGHHTLEGDIMWFAWALHTEAAHAVAGIDKDHSRRALFLAGVAMGCPANFVWRGHRRSRSEYHPDGPTATILRSCGLEWASDFEGAAREIHALFRIREWGQEG
jgi:hypothetical protein